jgi:voltage-gated potassium channel Kch
VFFLSTIFSYLFVATGFIFVSENSITTADGQVANLLDALYLIVISLSTVGYGDIVPKSALGRVVIMVLIVGAIIIIPQELAKLIKIFSSSRT